MITHIYTSFEIREEVNFMSGVADGCGFGGGGFALIIVLFILLIIIACSCGGGFY